ncbi:MAG: hypothetical protein ACRDJN_02355, partial [Chloroflexota bacterium]
MRQPAAAVRALGALDSDDLAHELDRLGVAPAEADLATRRTMGRAIRLEGLSRAVGQQLRDRMRALGGDGAIGPSVYATEAAPDEVGWQRDGGEPGPGDVEWRRDGGESDPSGAPVAGTDAVDVVLLGSVAQLEA